jgi:hypothetical protein
MRESRAQVRPGLVDRAARVAFAFVVMNCAAIAGLFAFVLRRKVWR